MTSKSSRRVPEEKAATPDEIAAAIEALTPADYARLNRYAQSRVRKLGPKAERQSGEELVSIALTSLLDGTRRWDKSNVGFVRFMIWAMRSISSNWAKKYEPAEAMLLAGDLQKKNPDGKPSQSIDAADSRPTAEKEMIENEERQAAKRERDAIYELFRDDEKAQMLLTGWEDGCDPNQIREAWGLTQKDYDTISRRIRRAVERSGLKAARERNA
jgi:hypothetical protein